METFTAGPDDPSTNGTSAPGASPAAPSRRAALLAPGTWAHDLVPAPTSVGPDALPSALRRVAPTVSTPALLLDPAAGVAAADALVTTLAAVLPAQLRYAMKAGPHAELLAALDAAGHGFELASPGEADELHRIAPAAAVLCGNPMLDRAALAHIRRRFPAATFTADSRGQLDRLAAVAPGARVLLRFHATDPAATFQLSEKFGAPLEELPALLVHAQRLGLVPYGLSFHLGSQSRTPGAWAEVIGLAGSLLTDAAAAGTPLAVLDIGGGFPHPYPVGGAHPEPILQGLLPALTALRAAHPALQLWCEPGRAVMAPASWLVSTVVALRPPTPTADGVAHLDAGLYHGLMEGTAMLAGFGFSCHHLPETSQAEPGPMRPWRLVGPTCDSYDALAHRYWLPTTLAEGDRLVFAHAGAYALGCSTTFNGFPPPTVVAIPRVNADPAPVGDTLAPPSASHHRSGPRS